MTDIRVSDHAVLRYLERAHGVDIVAIRRHLAGLSVNAVRLGAIAVTVEDVKLVIARNADESATIVTVMKPGWPSIARAAED